MSLLMSFLGGSLIGLAAIGLMIFNGRIAGISGILSSALLPKERSSSDKETGLAWQWFFLFGLVSAGFVYALLSGSSSHHQPQFNQVSTPLLIIGGLLVGLGSNIGSGCTSGHGICGIGRLSPRSVIATGVFMLTGMLAAVLIH